MEPDARGYASPRGWHMLFPDDAYEAVVAMSRFWSERGYLAGRVSMGDPVAFEELARFDPAAAELVASTVLSIDHLTNPENT